MIQTNNLENIFSNNTKSNNESWFTRDGRNLNSFSYEEDEKLFKEHLIKLKVQSPNLQEIQNIKFKIILVSSNSSKKQEINIKKTVPKLFQNFNGIPYQLWNNICHLQFKYLTPIQKEVIPFIQNGKDIVACAETGSGKTIAYLFPLIGNMLVKGTPKNPFLSNQNNNNNNKKLNRNKLSFPLSLVLVPTRELAQQVSIESKKMCFKTGIRTVCVYGGRDKNYQINDLNQGCDILIATPGRLIDLIVQKNISLKMISTLILDEADRMLDMGFKPQLDEIVNKHFMPDKSNRQNLLFSATFPNEVQSIANNYLKDFYFIHPEFQSPKQIEHEFIKVRRNDKEERLMEILSKKLGKYLVFVSTKNGVDQIGELLYNSKFNISCIHGDKSQDQRMKAIDNFSSGKTLILIATDVVGRGLDFPKVDIVINFNMPQNIDDYIHRIGRTGRIGQKGKAITFIDGSETKIFGKLVNYLDSQNQRVPNWLRELSKNNGNYMKKGFIEKKNNSINNEFSSEINWRDDNNKSDMNEKSNCCINEENWNNKEDSWNDNDKNKKEEENWFKIENNWNDKDNDNWNDRDDDNGWNNVFNESKTNTMNLNHKRKRSNDNFS